jgi:hypothetical protein
MTTEQIAKVCHEVNRAYCASLGDTSQAAWEDAPQWQRDSAVVGVEYIQQHQDAPPSASHESMAGAEAGRWLEVWSRQERGDEGAPVLRAV